MVNSFALSCKANSIQKKIYVDSTLIFHLKNKLAKTKPIQLCCRQVSLPLAKPVAQPVGRDCEECFEFRAAVAGLFVYFADVVEAGGDEFVA